MGNDAVWFTSFCCFASLLASQRSACSASCCLCAVAATLTFSHFFPTLLNSPAVGRPHGSELRGLPPASAREGLEFRRKASASSSQCLSSITVMTPVPNICVRSNAGIGACIHPLAEVVNNPCQHFFPHHMHTLQWVPADPDGPLPASREFREKLLEVTVYTFVYAYTCIYISVHIHTYTHAYTYKRARAHAHTRARACTHAYSHTFLHILAAVVDPCCMLCITLQENVQFADSYMYIHAYIHIHEYIVGRSCVLPCGKM